MFNSELEVLKFWQDYKVFEKSLEQNRHNEPYIFLDGPPFASGKPHIGHLSTGFAKDIFPRFWTQKGKFCLRRWGWDCHGLPVENFVQKQLQITDKRAIENEVGIARFNQVCRESVSVLDVEWRQMIERTGRWVDMDDQYRTLDNDYIESVWWGLGQIWNKNLIRKDYRVSLYSPTMGATLSHIEIADDVKYENETILTPIIKFQLKNDSARKLVRKIEEEINFQYSEQINYQNSLEMRILEIQNHGKIGRKATKNKIMQDKNLNFEPIDWKNFKTDLEMQEEIDNLKNQLVTVLENLDTLSGLRKILSGDLSVSLLAWTTTAWTLPANVALAVGAEIEYSLYHMGNTGELVILAENRSIPVLSLQLHDSVINSSEINEQANTSKEGGEYFEKLGINITKIVSFPGRDLEGIEYKPLFNYNPKTQIIDSLEQKSNLYKIYTADFVTDNDGTGVVHVAPAYGPEDYELKKQRNLAVLTCLNDFGEVRDDLDSELKPAFGKSFSKVGEIIMGLVEKKDQLFATLKYLHKVAVFARDNSKIYYNAKENWYIAETQILSRSLELNEEINWIPNHIKNGRFENTLKTAPDWCISRERYWGAPLPIWQTADKSKTIFVDSLAKLYKYALNPIYLLLNTRDLNPEIYENGKSVIITDNQFKLPLGLNTAQFRSKSLSEMRKDKKPNIQTFAQNAQKILDEIITLFEKYTVVQILLTDVEQKLWTTWLLSLHGDSKKISKVFYFYKKIKVDGEEVLPVGEVKLLDLHRPVIDDIILADEVGNQYTRIPEVMDCWVESGSAPWASFHYPFENKELVEKIIPSDYIVEYVGQIRGWFHALHILSTAIFDKPAFSNVHVHGTILGKDGKKMSKSKGNFDEPEIMINKVGSDALRLFICQGGYFGAEDLIVNDKDLMDTFRDSTLLLSNTAKFLEFTLKDKPKSNDIANFSPSNFGKKTEAGKLTFPTPKHSLNTWLLALTQNYCFKLEKALENYDLAESSKLFLAYLQDLSLWYIRRSKDLLVSEWEEETCQTLQFSLRLFCIFSASLQPFNTERIWSIIKNDSDPESVHLTSLPQISQISAKAETVIEKMSSLRQIISLIHKARKDAKLRVRQPLYADFGGFKVEMTILELLQKECNLIPKDLSLLNGEMFENNSEFGYLKIDLVVDDELAVLGYGRDFERAIQEFRKQMGYKPGEIVEMNWQIESAENEDLVQKIIQKLDWKKLAVEIKWAENLDPKLDKKIIVKDLVKILVD
jgi:isoleucyl-tRNA synthetase